MRHIGILILIFYSLVRTNSWIIINCCFLSFFPPPKLKCLALLFLLFSAVLSEYTLCVFLPSVLEKSEFKDDSQFFRFYADEEMEGTSSKSKQLQRNDFKLIENILAKSLVVSWCARLSLLHCPVWIPAFSTKATFYSNLVRWESGPRRPLHPEEHIFNQNGCFEKKCRMVENVPDLWNPRKFQIIKLYSSRWRVSFF